MYWNGLAMVEGLHRHSIYAANIISISIYIYICVCVCVCECMHVYMYIALASTSVKVKGMPKFSSYPQEWPGYPGLSCC